MAFEFKLPDLGEGIHEAEIISVKIKEGQAVSEDQPLLEVETDKAVVEIPSPVAGKITKIHVKEGQVVTVGSVMVSFDEAAGSTPAKIKSSGSTTAQSAPAVRESAKAAAPIKPSGTDNNLASSIPASPATRRLAREMGIDLRAISASGPGGLVLKGDLLAASQSSRPGTPAGGSSQQAYSGMHPLALPPVELPDFSKFGPVERVPIKSIRRKIALNMAISWLHVPRVAHFDECDVSDLNSHIIKHERKVAERGGRLTLTIFMLKAVASALAKYPQLNSSLDEINSEIIFKRYYNIGVAVATERGLIVPVIRDVDKKSVRELAQEFQQVVQKTRDGTIDLNQLQGGTFTITNVGSIGGTGMVAMVNFPEAAILGMAKSIPKPVVRNKKIESRIILPLSLSFDHRITDGAEAAYFMRHVVETLETPPKEMLEV